MALLSACQIVTSAPIGWPAERVRVPVEAEPPQGPTDRAAPASAVGNFKGPFTLADALTFHIVNQSGTDFTVRINSRNDRMTLMDQPMLVRVFDPQERMLIRHDEPGLKNASRQPIIDIELPVKASGGGVYQVSIIGFGGSVDLQTTPELPWGVYGVPELVGRGNQFADCSVYLPPRLAKLPIRIAGSIESFRLVDERSAERIVRQGSDVSVEQELPIDGEHIWKLSVRSAGEYKLNFGGLPIILCPDERTARAIHASVDVLEDGTICFHKFQIRAQRLLKKYRALDRSAFEVEPPVLVRKKGDWLAEPVRNKLLTAPHGVFATLPAALHEQNLDRNSPWFGSVYVWRDEHGQPRRENPWAAYDRLGIEQFAEHVLVFASVHAIDEPFNPLRSSPALLNRVIIGALQDLMMFREHEYPQTEIIHYAGGPRAFRFPAFTQIYARVAAECPRDVHEVWTEGLRRYAEAQTVTSVCDTVNQWTFIMLGLLEFAQGSGDSWFEQVRQRHQRWLLTRNQWNRGFAPAGYFDEGEGPDATYAGISSFILTCIQQETKDQNLLEALRRTVTLFNHTIAPEPNGLWLGSSSFCHRTPGDWTTPQMGAGLVMLADDLPEAAAHAGHTWMVKPQPRTAAELEAAERELADSLRYQEINAFRSSHTGPHGVGYGTGMYYWIWKHYSRHMLRGQLPMLAEERFTRNFGSEFFCVRRPGYYAFLYAGKPMGDWQKPRRPLEANRQYPRNGGGLCMFWSPRLGSSLLAKNWSAYAAHTIIAEHGNPKRADWEDYWSIQSSFDEANAKATITGNLRDLPLRFQKEYEFLEDRIECEVTLEALADVEFTSLVECFPFPLNKPDPLRASLIDAMGQPVARQAASAIVFSNSAPESHIVVFEQPRGGAVGIEQSRDYADQPLQHGRVLVSLPSKWKSGQKHTVKWTMMACPANRIAETVRKAANRQ